MKILIAHFIKYEEDSNNRFEYAYKHLNKKKDVSFLSSSFSHSQKRQRKLNKKLDISLAYEPGYPSNISPLRFISHFIFGLSIFKRLIQIKPKSIYFSFPSISLLFFIVLYKRTFNKSLNLTIDIQDLWPESYTMITQNKLIKVLTNFQEFWIRNSIKYINNVVACSNSFGEHFQEKYSISSPFKVVYIGTETNLYKKSGFTGKPKVVYIGNLSKSYDLKRTIDLISFAQRDIPDIQLDIIGDGDDFNELLLYTEQKKANVNFLGYRDIKYIRENIFRYQFAINPIVPNSVSSVLNKVADYAAAGLPVINTQNNFEYQNLLNEYQAGKNFQIINVEDIIHFINELLSKKETWELYSKGSIKLGSEKFNRATTYTTIEKLITNSII